jgi:hypothetical protein
MRGAIIPLLQYAFIAGAQLKHRDNFTFTFIHPVTFNVRIHVNKN